MKIFRVYDSKAEAYMPPFTSPTAGTAIRSFEAAVNEEGHEFQKFAGDYTLFEVGECDDTHHGGTWHDAPVNLGLALTFVQREGQLHAMPNDGKLRTMGSDGDSRVQGGE